MSQVLVRLVIKSVGVRSHEQFSLQWLSEQRQRWSATRNSSAVRLLLTVLTSSYSFQLSASEL